MGNPLKTITMNSCRTGSSLHSKISQLTCKGGKPWRHWVKTGAHVGTLGDLVSRVWLWLTRLMPMVNVLSKALLSWLCQNWSLLCRCQTKRRSAHCSFPLPDMLKLATCNRIPASAAHAVLSTHTHTPQPPNRKIAGL